MCQIVSINSFIFRQLPFDFSNLLLEKLVVLFLLQYSLPAYFFASSRHFRGNPQISASSKMRIDEILGTAFK